MTAPLACSLAQRASLRSTGDDADLRGPADVVLRIASVQLEIAPGRTITTVGTELYRTADPL
jgi:hypothetical protein